jgi:Zn-dependent oligopeptidase
MNWTVLSLALVPILLSGFAEPANAADRLSELQQRAAKFKSILSLPPFETTTIELDNSVRNTTNAGNAALDRIAALDIRKVTFDNTARALDDVGYQIALTMNRLSVIKETSPEAALRDRATSAIKELQEWAVGLDYREDVYKVLKAYADKKPRLKGEDAKLLFETMRDYRRAGLDLPKTKRDEVERMRKELSRLATDFESNVTKAEKAVKFTKADLEGVPDDVLAQIKTGDDEYTVMANVTWHYLMVEENARREETRKKLQFERNNLARTENIPLLEKILPLRDDIAKALGYKSWADYQTEVKMVKNAQTAIDFLEKLSTGLQPKYDAELAEFRALKVKETGDPNTQIHIWDWRYFSNQLKKQKYDVDAEQLRVYFPYQRVLEGMFNIYQSIFGLKFERIDPPYKWISDLQLYAVSDAKTGEPLGMFYLDMFPREGKYNHFAQFDLIGGKLMENGEYQRPTVALVCNFPAPSKDRPSLLSHNEVETLFHEFGHAMHSILTRPSLPLRRDQRPARLCRGALADARKLGVG